MLVVSVGVTGGRHHIVEVAGQAREAPERLSLFRLQQLTNPVHPSMLTPLADRLWCPT